MRNALGSIADVDDALRSVVEILAREPGVEWVGIAFLEGGTLVLGPQAGAAAEERRLTHPIVYEGSLVGELQVDGTAGRELVEQVAALVAPYVLIGWDTQGEGWEP